MFTNWLVSNSLYETPLKKKKIEPVFTEARTYPTPPVPETVIKTSIRKLIISTNIGVKGGVYGSRKNRSQTSERYRLVPLVKVYGRSVRDTNKVQI